MKSALLTLAVASLVAVGCQKKAADPVAGYPTNESVVDLSGPGYQSSAPAVAPQPVVYDSITAPQPAAAPESGPLSGGTYTIQKGDTLYSIARQRYGDGKQWTRIVDANPGLDPTRMPVGKVITIP